MAITSTGLGSGLDINGLVSGLVKAERDPALARLAQNEASLQAELSAVGVLKGALSTFQKSLDGLKDLATFSNRSASSSDSKIATFTTDKGAAVGSYSLEVTQLAKAQKIVSQQNYTVSEGSLTFTNAASPAKSFTVNLTSSNNATIESVRDAINNDSNNIGVNATILNINGNKRLVFNSKETGAENAVTITSSQTSGDLSVYNTATAGNYDTVTTAQDAQFKIDGQSLTSASNSVKDVIANTTIELKETNSGSTITLTSSQNNTGIKGQVDNLIKSYNELIGQINKLTSYNPTTKQAGALLGDSLVTNLTRQIRSSLTDQIANGDSKYTSLASIGITTNADGTLKLDSKKLDTALAADYDGVANLFANTETGIAKTLDDSLNNYLKSTGTFASRTDSINTKLKGITDSREQVNRKAASLEKRLLAQFNAMDLQVQQLRATGTRLTDTLKNLPGNVRKTT